VNPHRYRNLLPGLALLAAFTLPGGRLGETHGERMVMAEMTTIDPEHEPEG